MPKNVCVIGAGVSGLSSAILIAEAGHKVTVVAKEEGRETTSSIAAAFWYPFWTGIEPDHRWYKSQWAERSYEVIENLLETPNTGISKVALYEYFSASMSDDEIRNVIDSMWWKDRALPGLGFRNLSLDEVEQKSVRSMRFKAGISFRTFVVNMSDYLTYLRRRIDELEVSFEVRTIADIVLLSMEFDTVINCTGVGAKALIPDDIIQEGQHRISPVEGVVVQLPRIKGIDDISLIHTGSYFGARPLYIVPRGGSVPDTILGGTITEEPYLSGEDRKTFRPQHLPLNALPSTHWIRTFTTRIIKDCSAFDPRLENVNILEAKVGYRPLRVPEVRLEKEGTVIHNYGHAGGGVTFSWGCAEEVARWV